MWQRRIFTYIAPGTAGHGRSSINPISHNLSRRSGIEIAGAFILILVLAVIAASMRSAPAKTSLHNSTNPPAASLQVAPADPSAAASSSDTSMSSSSSNGSSVSTNVISSSDGAGSAQVTVNGQPVAVPNNGTAEGNVGNTHYTIVHQGSATNSNTSNVSLQVDSSSNVSKGGQ